MNRKAYMSASVVLLCIVALLSCALPIHADVPISFVSQWGGCCQGVAVSGNRAYLAVGPRLFVLDISYPSSPAELGRSDLLQADIYDLAVSGNYAYLNMGSLGMVVMDVSSPSHPTYVTTYSAGEYIYHLTVSGNYAYLACDNTGTLIIDISDPAHPAHRGTFHRNDNAWDVAVSGHYLYVSTWTGLDIADISSPSSPTYVGSCPTEKYGMAISVTGNHVCMSDYSNKLNVIDVSNPSSPVRVGTWAAGHPINTVESSGNFAYVSTVEGLDILDLSSPANPVLAGRYSGATSVYHLVPAGQYVYASDHYDGLRVINISNPSSPSLTGRFDLTGEVYSLDVAGNYAYLCTNAFRTLDISNPAIPTQVGVLTGIAGYYGQALSGNYAYVHSWNKLSVINISNPAAPAIAGSFTLSGGISSEGDMALSGSLVCECHNQALYVIDASNLSSIRYLGNCALPYSAVKLVVSGNYVYAVCWAQGLQVVDISDPTHPQVVGSHATNASAQGIAVSGNYAFVVTVYGDLEVFDISNPPSPTPVSTLDIFYNPTAIAIQGRYAYITDSLYGLMILDVSNPLAPVSAGAHSVIGGATNVTVSGSYAYVCCGGGFEILHLGPTITSVLPDHGLVDSTCTCQVRGQDFTPGATVKLTKQGEADIAASSTSFVDSTKLNCSFDLSSAPIGRWSVVVTTADGFSEKLADAFVIVTPTSQAKRAANNASASVNSIVTYLISTSQFYVESDDRSSGILVGKFGHGVTVGQRVSITGSARTLSSGEKYIMASTVTPNGTGTIEPLVLLNRSVGGGDWYYDSATGAGQKGMREYLWVKIGDSWTLQLSDSQFMNNTGLLITTFGKVTYSASGYFYIDDGSACRDNSAYIGVKVLGTVPVEAGVDPVGKYVKVTGVSSCFKGTSPDTSLYRQIRAADVTVIQ